MENNIYMIIHDINKEQILNNIVTLFIEYIAHCDLTPYFNINISNNITDDLSEYEKKCIPNENSNYAGLTILPYKEHEKIQILISENACTVDVVLHELTHMHDFILFSKYFCDNKLYRIREHKYFQTLIYWSEFHVKQIDIPYLHLFIDLYNNIPNDKLLYDFTSQIKTFFYKEYTKKLLSKTNLTIRDIMWYLGELYVCNLYDKNNTYSISQEMIDIYGIKIIELNNLLVKAPDFQSFVIYIEDLYNYFQTFH